MLAHTLAALGHEVVGEAGDADAGRALASQTEPDVVAIDGRLPGGGVLELVVALRADRPGTHALIIASLDETTLVRSAVRAGARAALLRPYTRTRVDETLRSLAPDSEKPL